MYIGELANRTGASPKAIRLYESMGLIPVAERKGKFRCYHEADVERIDIIKRAQKFGFKLSETGKMLHEGITCDDFPTETVIALLTEKIAELSNHIKRLKARKLMQMSQNYAA
jgi:DNA-binding transcriptional MerR regulator